MNESRRRFLRDIVVGALEEPRYWCETKDYDAFYGTAKVTVLDEDDEPQSSVQVAPQGIEEAIKRILSFDVMINKYKRQVIEIASKSNDSSILDQEATDTILQVAVMGEEVYQ